MRHRTGPIGVWYDTSKKEWAVLREDEGNMPVKESFNVLAVPPNKVGSSVFVQTATSANISGDSTFINSSLTNGKPGALLQVTQDWNPQGDPGFFNPHSVGVWYDAGVKEWAVFNEDLAAMPVGVSFNVMVGPTPSNGGKSVLLKTTIANESGDTTFISNAQTTGNPSNVVFDTQNWNHGTEVGVFNDIQTGVWYDGAEESVFNEDGSSPPLKSAFNVLIFSS